MELATLIMPWYRSVARDLPWRRTRDPYAIWVSEIMLQQTTVAAVIPYWERWMARFPTVESLAAAEEDDWLPFWAGLGYYRRGRLLHAGAREIVAAGRLPATVEEWRAVPGVGPYTAGAIASIALGLPAPLVDGNVERVYSRLRADPSTGGASNRAAWRWAAGVVPSDDPGAFNQGLMELGATVCVPRVPRCGLCPVSSLCEGFASGAPERFPTPVAKGATRAIEEWLEVAWDGTSVALERRPEGTWWQGMWALPRHASPPEELGRDAGTFRYAVTVHRIQAHVVVTSGAPPGARRYPWGELSALAIPAPDRKALGLARPFLA